MDIPSQELLKEDQKKGIGWYVLNVATLVFCIKENQLNVLLEKRNIDPEKDKWVVPGKFLNYGFSPEEIAQSKLREVLGEEGNYIEQLYLFGDPDKKLGKRLLTATYLLLVRDSNLKEEDNDLSWFPISQLPALAFDNAEIIKYGIDRLKNKASYSNIVFGLLPKKFRLSQLQNAYEVVLGKQLNKRNFRTKILSLGILKETGKKEIEGAHRPAMLYEFKNKEIVIIE